MMKWMSKIPLLLMVLFFSCAKPGSEEVILTTQITLQGTVMHHFWTVGSCKVYIKGNTTIYPGPQPSAYDSFTVADPGGTFIFSNLSPGYYYLFGKGYDPAWGDTVNGALFLNLQAHPGTHIELDTILNVSE